MTIPLLPARESRLTGFFKNDFVLAALIAITLSGLTFGLAYSLGWLTGAPNWFEVAGATINYGATYLSIKQRRFTYVLGFVASMAFAVAYYQYGLLASALLSAYLVGQLVYGYFRWGPDHSARPVHKFQWKWAWAYALATAATYAGAWAISTAFGGQFAFWDAAILVLTIAAQFLLDNKVLAAWYVWTLVNIVGVTLYATAGAPFAAIQQLIFGFANIYGWYSWRKSMQAAEVDSATYEAQWRDMPEVGYSEKFDQALLEKQLLSTDRLAVVDEMPEGSLKRVTGGGGSLKNIQYTPDNTLFLATGEPPKVRDRAFWRQAEEKDQT